MTFRLFEQLCDCSQSSHIRRNFLYTILRLNFKTGKAMKPFILLKYWSPIVAVHTAAVGHDFHEQEMTNRFVIAQSMIAQSQPGLCAVVSLAVSLR